VIGRDGRASGPMLAEAVRGGLCALGRDVIDADIAATPTVGVLVRQYGGSGGIQISASHNPPEYNGLKLFSAEGRVLQAETGQAVLTRYRSGQSVQAADDRVGSVTVCDDPLGQHCRLVLATVDVQRIRSHCFKVLLDANHGAGSLLGRLLLEELGCQLTLVGGEPDGLFAHPAEPTAENLRSVLQQVTGAGAEIGFCQDPDADRLAVIDRTGRYLGEEYTLAMCLDHVLRRQQGPVVTNCASSRMSQDLAEKYGVPFFRSPVGEANVVQAMLAHGAVFGGEGNGGPIDPRVGYVRDSFVGMAQLLDAMAARELPISQLADELPRYEIHKTKVSLPREKIPPALAALEKHFAEATADHTDGLRLDWPGKWLLMRASNTEPIVRVIAEAGTLKESKRLCEEAGQAVLKITNV